MLKMLNCLYGICGRFAILISLSVFYNYSDNKNKSIEFKDWILSKNDMSCMIYTVPKAIKSNKKHRIMLKSAMFAITKTDKKDSVLLLMPDTKHETIFQSDKKLIVNIDKNTYAFDTEGQFAIFSHKTENIMRDLKSAKFGILNFSLYDGSLVKMRISLNGSSKAIRTYQRICH